jgi:hypothetical protein
VPEEHVRDDVEVVAQRQVLVDRRDPERLGVTRAVEVDRLPFPHDLPAIRSPQPRDRLDRDGLSRAVVPRQRRDLAGRNLEIDPAQRLNRTEVLRQATQLEQLAVRPAVRGYRCGRAVRSTHLVVAPF